MATPTLDEIEANVQRVRGRVSPMQDATCTALDAVLALVAHVRALTNTTMVIDQRQRGAAQRVDMATERTAALEEKVSALSAADDVGRAAARAESATSPRMAQKAWAPVAEELDRLRAENAAQSKALEEALLLGKDALFAAQAREQKLAEENAELRKRVEAGAWPAPQPIETAPLGRTVFWYSIAFKEWRCFAVTAEDMDEVRAGYSHWLPMPPPPGGGK